MITPKIKALFQFIDFLHSNIDNFKQYDEVISEYNLLCKEQQKESPRKNFASKLKYDEVQAEKNDMFKVIKESIIQPLQTKATELKICDWNNTETLWNYNISEINSIKKNFSKDDLPEIFKYKSKYIDYRTKTNCSYSQDSFFKNLDEIFKELFGYFKKETERNEFEAFESKAMKVNDSFLNPPKTQQPQNKPLQPQQNAKRKPELKKAIVLFSSPEIIESLHNELKGYFQGSEPELKRALKGEQLNEFLLFPHNQNKFVEVFKRLKYNGFLLSTPKEIKDWICSTFTYQYQKGSIKEVREFNTSTVHDILTKDKGEPTKKERICIVDWLPYKSHLTRQREAEKENV